MDINESAAYSTHLQDQIDAAQEESERLFVELAETLGRPKPEIFSEDDIKDSYFGESFPWIYDPELKSELVGCEHIMNPQPLWVFFGSPAHLYCSDCALALQFFRTTSYVVGDTNCDVCETQGDLSWTFTSYQFFTLAGLVCKPCIDTQSSSLPH